MSATQNAPSNAAPRKAIGRQITYTDVEQIISAAEANPDFVVELLYFSREQGHFVRATATPRRTRYKSEGGAFVTGVSKPILHRKDRDSPSVEIGHEAHLNIVTEFGTSTSAYLVTTAAADARGYGYSKSVVGSLELLIADANGDRDVDLVGVYGVSVNANLIVQGADLEPDEVAAEVEQVLAAHFGARGKDVRAKARPVADYRVDVYTPDMGKALALNVLVSEAYRFAEGAGFTTVPSSGVTARSEA